MDLYKYDKAVLPKIPDVDSEYPYAAMLKNGDDYYLYITNAKGKYADDKDSWVFLSGTNIKGYYIENGNWINAGNMTLPEDEYLSASEFIGIWSSYDVVYTSDGSKVKFASSEPTLYVPKIYRFGNVLLPEFMEANQYDAYKNAIIITWSENSIPRYALLLTTTPCYTSEVDYTTYLFETDPTASCIVYGFDLMLGNWGVSESAPLNELKIVLSEVDYNVLWTSTDIRSDSPDSSEIYKAASELEEYNVKQYRYNDFAMSELPIGQPNVDYPYAFIMHAENSGVTQTALFVSNTKFYVEGDEDSLLKYITPMNATDSVSMWVLGSFTGVWSYIRFGLADSFDEFFIGEENGTTISMVWSNYNVPLGSADSTTWYLEASEPVLVEEEEEEEEKVYAIMGSTMTAIGNQARRLGGTNAKLTPTEMISKLSNVDLVGVANLLGGCASSSTADIKSQEQSLIDTANATTGGTAKDLTTAQNALIEGYGQGGGSDSGGSGCLHIKETDLLSDTLTIEKG